MGIVKPIFPEGLLTKADLHLDLSKLTSVPSEPKVLDIKTANEWIAEAKNKPIPLPLLDCLWFEGELAILFADTNLGK